MNNDLLIVTAHQPTVFPYVGIWRRFFASNLIDLNPFDHFNSGADYFVHRVHIGLDSNKEWLAAPLDMSHNKYRGKRIAIKDVGLSHKPEEWNNFWCQIERIYSSYPYYKEVYEMIRDTKYLTTNLSDFNIYMFTVIRDYLELSNPICISSVPIGDNTSNRVLYTIKQYGRCNYLSGNTGRTYIDIDYWNKNNINVVFQDEYTYDNSLIADMKTVSILSILFTYSKEVAKQILTPISGPILKVIQV